MRSSALLAVLLALTMACAATVMAQAPSPTPSVTVEAEQSQGTVTVERARSFAFTVCNTSPATGSPLDQQNKGNVFVNATSPWGTPGATPSAFDLVPGTCQRVEVEVTVPTGSGTGGGDLVLSATMYSPLRGLEPILGPGGATQEARGSASMQLTVDESLTRDVLETLGPWIYAVLLLLVAAILVAIAVSVSARRTLVRLTAEGRELVVTPGGKAVFSFRAEGLANEQDTVLLQVSAVQPGWAAFLPVPELTLEPGQVQDLSLVVIAPRDAFQGTRQAVLVTATSAKAPKGAATLELVAVVEGPEDLPAAPRRRKE